MHATLIVTTLLAATSAAMNTCYCYAPSSVLRSAAPVMQSRDQSPARRTTLRQKVEAICNGLNLAKGDTIAETIETATRELGLKKDEKEELSLAQKVGACLQCMGMTGMKVPDDPAELRAQLIRMRADNALLRQRIEEQDEFITEALARLASPSAGQLPLPIPDAKPTTAVAGAAVQFMITQRMRTRLVALGFSDAEIDRLEPSRAAELIKSGESPGPPGDVIRRTRSGAGGGSSSAGSAFGAGGSSGGVELGGDWGSGWGGGGGSGYGGGYGVGVGGGGAGAGSYGGLRGLGGSIGEGVSDGFGYGGGAEYGGGAVYGGGAE